MSVPLYIKTNGRDNVAIAVNDIPTGTQVTDGVVAEQDISQAHKITPCDISEDGRIVRYGMVLDYVTDPIEKGQWTNEIMPKLPTLSSVDEMTSATNLVTDLPDPPVVIWEGYVNLNRRYGGTGNTPGISTTVQCVTGVLNVAVERMKRELLSKYPNVDDTVPINHACGCGVTIDASEARVPIRVPRNLAKHPNFGGELMVVDLGCRKFTAEMLLDEASISLENMIILQEKKGFDDMISSPMGVVGEKLAKLNRRTRQTLPLSGLFTGMQCGGSDAFSGVTANPSAGYAIDMLVKGGATVLSSEVTEVRDGAYLPGEHCVSSEAGKKLTDEMKWYDQYPENGQMDRSVNPTPGNKKGGLSNIVEKAVSPTAKLGISPIVEVLPSVEKPSKKGLIYAAIPVSGIVCGPCQLVGGTGLQAFMTGRGISYDLVVAPVIKIRSRNDMKMQWQDLIDVNAGPIATGEATTQEIGTQLFHEIIDVASGRKQSFAERHRLYNDFYIFNPASIT